ncbi:hypothetical protein [Vibrio sp. 10N.261.55.A7]|uniref:hypothetical protein n=1 Tax=Vibrio sp. 10N.261.55.A7 TaxID=1880851 RepID=UPI000C8217C1|nr:hypothetical protein [Vibrio sp. 10N.261.55.A7]PMJ92870.1 hypothetical protein BCU12_06930 [Vibrio sp. 10N.261.55.A7]
MTPITWPTNAQTIQTRAETVTDQIGTEMNNALSRLTTLESDADYGRHPLSVEAGVLNGLRDDLNSLIQQGTVISATPYQYEVGQKLESGYYLTPNNARDTLTAKLRDQTDTHRSVGYLHCIAVMLSASNKESFATSLSSITQMFTLPDWMQTSRQAIALTTHERDKLHVPSPIIQPRFKPKATVNALPLYDYERHQAAQIATLESLASDATNVIGKLSALAIKRANVMAKLKADINALKTLQGSVWAVKFSGTPESIATQLQNTAMPNTHQHTIMSLMLSHEPLTFFEQLLNAG